jgi:translation initiation factor 2 beta subunit (eIF-2beta)/eIF-5
MSCPLHSNDNSCAGCAKIKVNNLETELLEAREVQNKLGEWVSHYIYCMRTVDYCGSLEDALEMEQYLYELKEKGE